MQLLRYAVLLLLIAMAAPSAAAALAVTPRDAAVRGVAAGPAEYNLGSIDFALEKGDNNVAVNPSTRFAFGPRRIYATFDYRNANPGDTLKWVLRFAETDVAWGEETIGESREGRLELELERIDGDYLMIGTFRLTLDAQGRTSGDVRSGSFEIYDPDRSDNGNDNGDDNGNSNENGNDNFNNNDNGDDDDNDND